MSHSKRTNWIAWGVLLLFAVVMAYPLSLGPGLFLLVRSQWVLSEPEYWALDDVAIVIY